MTTLATVWILSSAFLQEPPDPPARPPSPETPRRAQDPRELERRADGLRARLEQAPEGSPQREELQRELRRLEGELQRLRSQPPRPEPPRPPFPPQPPRPEGFRPLSNAEEVRGWLRENEPETARRLAQLEGEGRREEVVRLLHEAQGRMRAHAEMKERDPKAFERLQEMRRMERHSLDLGDRARRAAGEDKDRAVKELTEVLKKLFDLREETRVQELAELKRRVEALEKAIEGRKANKDKIVEKRRKELLGERLDDEW
jgi:hypothetical protein